jgi:hypothetical protein
MDQHDGRPLTTVSVMQPDTVNLYEGAARRVPALGPQGGQGVGTGEDGEDSEPFQQGVLLP